MGEEIHLDTIIIGQNDTPTVKEKTPYKDDTRNPVNYKTIKKWVYFLLERPSNRVAFVYHFTSLLMILGSLVVSVLATIEEMENELENIIFYYEMFLLFWFSLEFAARMWSCSYISRYQGNRGRLRFLFSVYMLIDIFVILSTITTFAMQIHGSYFSILRVTRFMQVFRILRIDRQRGDFKTMGNVVKEHGKELITVYFVGFVIMFSATYIVYLVEKHSEIIETSDTSTTVSTQPSTTSTPVLNQTLGASGQINDTGPTVPIPGSSEVTINNMANGLYWAVITVTSVGYGDFSPVTWIGKICCAIFALIGCAFFSLPAGILGSGFALQVAKQKKEKRFVKVRNPAAYLIQTMWRNYALKKEQRKYEATWYYLLPMLRETDNRRSQQTLDQMMRRDIQKGTLDLGEMFPPIFSPERSRTLHSLYMDELLSSSEIESAPLLNNNSLDGGFKKLGKIISRRRGEGIILNKENLLKAEIKKQPPHMPSQQQKQEEQKQQQHRNGCERKFSLRRKKCVDGSHDVNEKEEEKIHQLIHERYKIALRFVMRLRYWTAIKIFKSVRHPFVNMQDILEKNALSHVEMLSHVKNMRDSFNVLQQELIELRYHLIELKEEKEKDKTILTGRHNNFFLQQSRVHGQRLRRSRSFTAVGAM